SFPSFSKNDNILMKTKFFLAFCLLFSQFYASAQTACSNYYPLKEGAKLGYTYYNDKGKVESSSLTEVKTVKQTDDGGMEAQVMVTIMDKKGEEQMKGEYLILCDGEQLYMDVTSMLNPALKTSFQNLEVTVDGDALVIPTSMSVGQQLPDASSNIKAGSSGISILNMTIQITDRQVLDRAVIQTAAGSFDCFKLTQTTSVNMVFVKSFQTLEYYAQGIGVVRSETYDKKGNLESYMELTTYEP
ncbi:MAG TPA: hypothetical protein PKA00_23610, partial [Saprospiraceae bacterium]|nr:hypothetical protein [Saprospiraceae bacterium]